jgi:hypothetical protein
MTALSPANLDRAFALLVECAVKGERCPITSGPDQHPLLIHEQVSMLARAGRIRVETSGRNFRQITILTGPHAGKKTAPNPNANARIFRTMDGSGVVSNTAAGGYQPSAPRPLTREELSR